jgi:hypothetical protein
MAGFGRLLPRPRYQPKLAELLTKLLTPAVAGRLQQILKAIQNF